MLGQLKKLVAVFLVGILLLSASACQKEQEPEQPLKVIFYNVLPVPEGPDQSAMPLQLGYKEKAKEKHEQNEHAVGWLAMEDTSLDDVVLFAPEEEDRFYYLRRGFNKEPLFEGSYFIDSRSYLTGMRDGFSKNIVIYGHSMTDDAESPLFSQFKKLRDPEWAKEHPYIYFSTLEEDMAWEIFAAFDTHVTFIYNVPDPKEEEYQEILDGARKRSIYDYDVEVTPEDTILTLSTCIYNYNGTSLSYPNDYRYVVMARLVPMGEPLKEEATFEINEDVYID